LLLKRFSPKTSKCLSDKVRFLTDTMEGRSFDVLSQDVKLTSTLGNKYLKVFL